MSALAFAVCARDVCWFLGYWLMIICSLCGFVVLVCAYGVFPSCACYLLASSPSSACVWPSPCMPAHVDFIVQHALAVEEKPRRAAEALAVRCSLVALCGSLLV